MPGLHDSFGVLWPLVLVAVIGGFVRRDLPRAHPDASACSGVVALLSGIAYLFTPLTAAGPRASRAPSRSTCATPLPRWRWARCCWRSTRGSAASASSPGSGRARRPVPGRASSSGADDVWKSDYLVGAILLAVFLIGVPVALTLASRWGLDRPTIAVGGGARDRPGRRHRLGPQRRLRRRPLPGGHRARRLPGRASARRWRCSSEEDPRGRPHRRGRRTPGLQAVRLLRRRPLQPRPVRRPPGRPRGLHPDRDRPRGHRRRRGLRGVADGAQRRRLRLRRRSGPTSAPRGSRRSRPSGRTRDPAAEQLLEDDLTFVFALDGELDPAGCASRPRAPAARRQPSPPMA